MLEVESEGLPNRKVIDEVKNNQWEMFVDFLRSVNMGVVNGRKGWMLSPMCQARPVAQ